MQEWALCELRCSASLSLSGRRHKASCAELRLREERQGSPQVSLFTEASAVARDMRARTRMLAQREGMLAQRPPAEHAHSLSRSVAAC